MKNVIIAALCVAFSSSGFAQVDRKGVEVKGLHISAGAIQLVGTILTASSEDKKGAVAIGWTLILLGLFSEGGDIAFGAELYNKETEIALYGDGQTSSNTQIRANVKKVLQETEMEALIAANDPQLASGLTISEFAKSLNVSSERLGQLVVNGKSFADGKLANKQFAVQRVSVNKAEIIASTGRLSDAELKVVTNYLRLRNIAVL